MLHNALSVLLPAFASASAFSVLLLCFFCYSLCFCCPALLSVLLLLLLLPLHLLLFSVLLLLLPVCSLCASAASCAAFAYAAAFFSLLPPLLLYVLPALLLLSLLLSSLTLLLLPCLFPQLRLHFSIALNFYFICLIHGQTAGLSAFQVIQKLGCFSWSCTHGHYPEAQVVRETCLLYFLQLSRLCRLCRLAVLAAFAAFATFPMLSAPCKRHIYFTDFRIIFNMPTIVLF